jgi:hypothetical protein
MKKINFEKLRKLKIKKINLCLRQMNVMCINLIAQLGAS